MTKAPVVAALGVIPWAAATGNLDEWVPLGKGFLLTLAIAWAAIMAVGNSEANPADTWGKRLRMATLGLLVGAFAFWLDGWPGPNLPMDAEDGANTDSYLFGLVRMSPTAVPILGHYALYFAAALGLIRWWKMTGRDRKDRFSLFPPIAAGFWGLVLSFLWPWHSEHLHFGVVPLALAAVAVQWVSPWTPPPPPMPRRLRWKG